MKKFDKSMFGRKVKFTNAMVHEEEPWFYPEVGTIGTIVPIKGTDFDDMDDLLYVVQWPEGTTSEDDLWAVADEDIELVDEDMEIEVMWTGEWPCLCSGEWILKINGEDKSDLIPDKLRTSPMGTYGTYEKWYFDKHWNDVTKSYKNGLKCDKWINENRYWLNNISVVDKVQKQLYEAFRANDWRYGI